MVTCRLLVSPSHHLITHHTPSTCPCGMWLFLCRNQPAESAFPPSPPPHRPFLAMFDLRGGSWLLPFTGLLVSLECKVGCFCCGPRSLVAVVEQAGKGPFPLPAYRPLNRVQGRRVLLPDPREPGLGLRLRSVRVLPRQLDACSAFGSPR